MSINADVEGLFNGSCGSGAQSQKTYCLHPAPVRVTVGIAGKISTNPTRSHIQCATCPIFMLLLTQISKTIVHRGHEAHFVV